MLVNPNSFRSICAKSIMHCYSLPFPNSTMKLHAKIDFSCGVPADNPAKSNSMLDQRSIIIRLEFRGQSQVCFNCASHARHPTTPLCAPEPACRTWYLPSISLGVANFLPPSPSLLHKTFLTRRISISNSQRLNKLLYLPIDLPRTLRNHVWLR